MFSNNLFGNTSNNNGSSIFGNAPSLFNNNTNNLNGGNNEDMSISPVRSPNVQPKMSNTSKNIFN